MRSIIVMLLGFFLILAGCDSITGKITPESVVAEIQKDCGIVTTVADIAALITANPAVASVAVLAQKVCDAFKAQKAQLQTNQRGAASGVVVVDNVDIHFVVK